MFDGGTYEVDKATILLGSDPSESAIGVGIHVDRQPVRVRIWSTGLGMGHMDARWRDLLGARGSVRCHPGAATAHVGNGHYAALGRAAAGVSGMQQLLDLCGGQVIAVGGVAEGLTPREGKRLALWDVGTKHRDVLVGQGLNGSCQRPGGGTDSHE